jgi:hypothetical protein
MSAGVGDGKNADGVIFDAVADAERKFVKQAAPKIMFHFWKTVWKLPDIRNR